MESVTPQEESLLNGARVGRLATADAEGKPHLIPICFAYNSGRLYSVLDQKPKRTSPTNLKRVRNILANPNVAVVVDHYAEEWDGLWYVLVRGVAQLLRDGKERQRAIELLRSKYPQYRDMAIDENPVIKITPTKVTSWGTLPKGSE